MQKEFVKRLKYNVCSVGGERMYNQFITREEMAGKLCMTLTVPVTTLFIKLNDTTRNDK